MKNHNLNVKTNLKHRSYLFALQIIKLIDGIDKKDLSFQIIAKQVLRSATSVGANIIEAHASSPKRDFINFFHYALKSANETKFWLALLRDSSKIKRDDIDRPLQELIEIANMLGASILTMKNKR